MSYLDERPSGWRMKQLDDDGDAEIETDGVLTHLRSLVSARQVTQGTNLGWQESILSLA